MSKAKILEHIGNARYKIQLQTDYEPIRAKIAALETQIGESSALILDTLEPAVISTRAALNAIDVPNPMPTGDAMAEIMRELMTARHAYDAAVRALNDEKLNRETLRDEKGKLETIEEFKEVNRWCADYNTELAPDTEVGVINFYRFTESRKPDDEIIIPGGNAGGEATYKAIRDGRTFPLLAMKTHSWWFAMMTAPLLERYDPLYRLGKITVKNNDGTVDVAIDDYYTQVLRTGADELTDDEINLTHVPVKYLNCDAAAFKVDDRVIVEYPRTNLHTKNLVIFNAQRDSMTAKLAEMDALIAQSQAALDDQQTVIDDLQTIVDAKNALLQDEQNANGINDLKDQLDALETEINDLKAMLTGYENTRDSAATEIYSLTQQLNSKTAQRDALIQERETLIANGAPQAEIDAKQAEINAVQLEIDAILASLSDQLAIENLAISNVNTTNDEIDAKAAERSELETKLVELSNINTEAEQELLIALDKLAAEIVTKTQLETTLNGEKEYRASIDDEITHLVDLIAQETGKEAALKAYTDTRPTVKTVVGFESRPRPCQTVWLAIQTGATPGIYELATGTGTWRRVYNTYLANFSVWDGAAAWFSNGKITLPGAAKTDYALDTLAAVQAYDLNSIWYLNYTAAPIEFVKASKTGDVQARNVIDVDMAGSINWGYYYIGTVPFDETAYWEPSTETREAVFGAQAGQILPFVCDGEHIWYCCTTTIDTSAELFWHDSFYYHYNPNPKGEIRLKKMTLAGDVVGDYLLNDTFGWRQDFTISSYSKMIYTGAVWFPVLITRRVVTGYTFGHAFPDYSYSYFKRIFKVLTDGTIQSFTLDDAEITSDLIHDGTHIWFYTRSGGTRGDVLVKMLESDMSIIATYASLAAYVPTTIKAWGYDGKTLIFSGAKSGTTYALIIDPANGDLLGEYPASGSINGAAFALEPKFPQW